jgi:homoserine dehydrogenase
MTRTLTLALIGFGNVGQGFAQILRDHGDRIAAQTGVSLRLVAVATRTRGSLAQAHGLSPAALLDAIAAGHLDHYPDAPGLVRGLSADAIARETAADVLLEAGPTDLHTGEPALSLCLSAFAAGKHVVLANKGPVAAAYPRLAAAADAAGRLLRFEGTVMAGTPSIRLATQALAGCTIREARGIINGSTNYMLTLMENGRSYADALADAQSLGYVEADPRADVDGWDAAGKAIILAAVLFGKTLTLDGMAVQGISGLTTADIARAAAAGERWRLIAHVSPEGASVAPVRLPVSHPLAGVSGATNAITYTTDLMGDITLIGAGAGRVQTGFALLSDVLDIARSTSA